MRRTIVPVVGLLVAISLMAARGPQTPAMPKRIVDLSPVVDEELPERTLGRAFFAAGGWPSKNRFENLVYEKPIYAADAYYTIFNHGGPHVDPPNHMIKGAKGVDQMPPEQFYGRARVFDFRSKPKEQALTRADFEKGGIRPGEIVIAAVEVRPPSEADGFPSFAFLSGEAAEYLAAIPVRAFAICAPSVANLREVFRKIGVGETDAGKVVPEHLAFLRRGIPIIEGLENCGAVVGEKNVVFAGFPLKFKDGNGSPVRAVALVY